MIPRTRTMELRALRERMNESPPPPPQGATIREWFAGLAMASNDLMKDVAPENRAKEAVRLADDLVAALAVPRCPSQESLAAPSEAALAEWAGDIARRAKRTIPDLPRPRIAAEAAASRKSMLPITRADLPAATRYSLVDGDVSEE